MTWPLRGRAALLLVPTLLLLACTRGDPAPGGDVAVVRSAAAAPAPAAPAAPAPAAATPADGLPGTEALQPTDPRVKVAVETANDLFIGRYDAVTARLEAPLRQELSPAALRNLVAGVVAAHGEPARVMDAWAGEVTENGLTWPTSSVLLRMSRSPVRFRLLLVFNPDGSLRGLWLRPL